MFLALLACSPPPPAPEGLDASTSYMVSNFYADDALFQAGIQGFMGWFEDEGKDLVGVAADSSNTDSFTIGYLTEDDVAQLPLSDEILLNGEEDTWGPRDMNRAAGVVSLAEMECDWIETEDYLVRTDQDNVFAGDWEGYERTYVSSREDFQAASRSGEFTPIEEGYDPFADGFDPSQSASTILFTDNNADPSAVLGVDMQPYLLKLDLRHGIYEVDGEDLGVMAILTYNSDAVWDEEGKNGLIQTYSMELNVERPGDKTLRMLAVWAEPFGLGAEPDDAFVLNYAVNKSLDSSNRIGDICSGDVEVPAEP